jgi:hypothetical protein
MLNANHPDDERLSALAFDGADAATDASTTAHVSTCDRCADLVNELGALRASLAELPDVAPPWPLRLLPEVAAVEPSTADRLAGWVRRAFAPALTAGAALALVGLVGTASPALEGMTMTLDGGAAPEQWAGGDAAEPAGADESAQPHRAVDDGAPAAEGDGEVSGADPDDRAADDPAARGSGDDFTASGLPADRSPWPMVLFAGVALMIGAALLRWILVPRAG